MKNQFGRLIKWLLLITFVSFPMSVSFATERTRQPEAPDKVVALAEMLAFTDFPRVIDILAIARVESMFREKAKNGISNGMMQVNNGPFEVGANLQAGVKLLREYYEKLRSINAAVTAYNIGIGSYLKGRRNHAYLGKYQRAKKVEEGFRSLRNPGRTRVCGSILHGIPFSPGVYELTRSSLLVPVRKTCEGEVLRRQGKEGDFWKGSSG